MGIVCAVQVLSCVVGTGVSVADTGVGCPDVPSSEGARRKLAGEWFGRAQNAAEKGQYAIAVEAFECSLRMVEHPDTVFNAAKAARLAGDPERAVAYAKKYLILAPEGAVAAEAANMIEELGESVSEEAGSAESQGTTEPPTSKPPAETQEPRESDVAAEGGVSGPAHEDTTPPEPAVDETAPSGAEARSEGARSEWFIAGTITLGAGATGLVVGAVMQGIASKAWADGKDTDSYEDFQKYQDKLSGFQTAALAGLIAGGIVAGAGVLILVLRERENRRTRPIVLYPSGVGISGRF